MATNTPTPHNSARHGEIAPIVIMAGDPLRAQFIAETFLEDAVMYNSIRGMYGYTGTYKGTRISVQGHGMGIPSIGIYTYELFHFYGVEKIIRVGTCGGLSPDVKIGTIVLAQGASTDSSYGEHFGLDGHLSALADFGLLRTAAECAEEQGLPFRAGNVLSSDVFYQDVRTEMKWAKFGVIGVEMESYGLYLNAADAGKKSLTILTVSDNIVTHEGLSAEERQLGMSKMCLLALETAIR